VSTVIHDAVGRDSVVRTPIGSDPADTARRIQKYQYDAMSRVLVGVDSAPAYSGSTSMQAVSVLTAYDNEGQATALTRRVSANNDIVTNFEYDAAGRLTRQYDPYRPGAETRWRYAPSGRALMIVRPTGTDSTDLDLLGRPAHRLVSGVGGDPSTADEQTFGYDAVGNLTVANNRSASIGREYFPNGLLKSDTLRIANADRSFTGAHDYVVSYSYDREGRRTSLSRPAQLTSLGLLSTTTYDYDPETGALAHVNEPSVGLFTYTYYLNGQLQALSRPDGSIEGYAYREDGVPSSRLEGPRVACLSGPRERPSGRRRSYAS